MAQEFVESGKDAEGVPFVTVKEGGYPNIHLSTYKGDNIPARFLKQVKEEKEVSKKNEKQDLEVNKEQNLFGESDPDKFLGDYK